MTLKSLKNILKLQPWYKHLIIDTIILKRFVITILTLAPLINYWTAPTSGLLSVLQVVGSAGTRDCLGSQLKINSLFRRQYCRKETDTDPNKIIIVNIADKAVIGTASGDTNIVTTRKFIIFSDSVTANFVASYVTVVAVGLPVGGITSVSGTVTNAACNIVANGLLVLSGTSSLVF